jgi:hypothetical protein
LLDQRIDGALDQLAQIATGQRVAQELARLFELLIELGAAVNSTLKRAGDSGSSRARAP